MKIDAITYKGLPVFGKDSSPQNTSEFLALVGTAIFWIIAFIFLLFAKPFNKKPEYKPVQIVLSSTPVKKTEKSAESSSAAASAAKESTKTVENKSSSQANKAEQAASTEKPETESSSAKQKVTEKTEQKTSAKPVPKTEAVKQIQPKNTASQSQQSKNSSASSAKTVTEAKKPEIKQPEVYAKSTEELMAEQFAQKKQSKTVDWDSMFADEEQESSSASQNSVKTVQTASSLEGTSGTGTTASSGAVSSSSGSSNSENQTASSSTLSALGTLKKTTFTGSAGISHTSQLNAQAVTGNGKSQLAMADGSVRTLIEPAQPVINISEENAALIDSSRNVTINFEITESGNVQNVNIVPAAIIPLPVQNEIIAQIKHWRFEAASYTSSAKFQYSIIKK